MSHFITQTQHPVTGKWEDTEWLDGYFGGRNYGVRFPSDGMVFTEEQCEKSRKRWEKKEAKKK